MKDRGARIKLQRACSCALFLAIAGILFIRATYLFRNVGFDRSHIVGIKEEKALDMVYIGGSAAFFFWQPLNAWKDYGFTSYNYATTTLQAEMVEPYVREVLRYQDPELFVIGLRSFQYWNPDFFHVVGFRNGSDSMDCISPNRLQMIRDCLGSRPDMASEPAASYYFDIAKYHSNYREVLGNPEHWLYRGNAVACADKGGERTIDHAWFEQPMDFLTQERAELPEECEALLIELLESCRERNLQVLFVVCPYVIEKEDQMKYNAMKDLVEGYGFQYLNANEHYDEMGIDFARDFYDQSHVNCFGAEKYTAFLGKYIMDRYQLPDHRGDAQYEDWEEAYAGFAEEEKTAKGNTEALIAKAEGDMARAQAMPDQTDFHEWAALAESDAFGKVIVSTGKRPAVNLSEEILLQGFGIYDQMSSDNVIMVHSQRAEEAYGYVGTEPQSYDGAFGELPVHVETGEGVVLQIGEAVYSSQEEGIYIAVVDLASEKIIDCIALREGIEDTEMVHFELR